MPRFRFSPGLPKTPPLTPGDAAILLVIAALVYVSTRLGFHSPSVIAGPAIVLSPRALPWYALLSIGRMLAAYVLSLTFTLSYGYAAAHNRTAERVLMPLLDVLQSVPILSFLPVVLLGLTAFLPQAVAAELAAIVLIFTSQAWNMTFSFYQSVTTIPIELREASAIFRLNPWLRFKKLELPFAAIGLIWNSMMSWSGGWFFLMAAEIFTVGDRDFRLPGLGAYLQVAASAGDLRAIGLGIATLVVVIVALDQLVWRPILAWADKFKASTVEGDEEPQSRLLDALSRSWIVEQIAARVARPCSERIDARLARRFEGRTPQVEKDSGARPARTTLVFLAVCGLLVIYGAFRAAGQLLDLPSGTWGRIALAVLATLGRVAAALGLALLWTVPVGAAIGMNRRLAAVLQPIVQVLAAIPATALFPVFLLALLSLRGGLNLAAILLMLTGTQWYLLFNTIAGAFAIPQDLRYTTDLLRLSRWDRWRTLLLPALFPYLVTGAITAGGGAWNASIVAEYVKFRGEIHSTPGIGSFIAEATASGRYDLLLAGTLALIITVVLINRLFWLRLYRVAEERYRME
jgi:NitT/TauT family transport system permease protein